MVLGCVLPAALWSVYEAGTVEPHLEHVGVASVTAAAASGSASGASQPRLIVHQAFLAIVTASWVVLLARVALSLNRGFSAGPSKTLQRSGRSAAESSAAPVFDRHVPPHVSRQAVLGLAMAAALLSAAYVTIISVDDAQSAGAVAPASNADLVAPTLSNGCMALDETALGGVCDAHFIGKFSLPNATAADIDEFIRRILEVAASLSRLVGAVSDDLMTACTGKGIVDTLCSRAIVRCDADCNVAPACSATCEKSREACSFLTPLLSLAAPGGIYESQMRNGLPEPKDAAQSQILSLLNCSWRRGDPRTVVEDGEAVETVVHDDVAWGDGPVCTANTATTYAMTDEERRSADAFAEAFNAVGPANGTCHPEAYAARVAAYEAALARAGAAQAGAVAWQARRWGYRISFVVILAAAALTAAVHVYRAGHNHGGLAGATPHGKSDIRSQRSGVSTGGGSDATGGVDHTGDGDGGGGDDADDDGFDAVDHIRSMRRSRRGAELQQSRGQRGAQVEMAALRSSSHAVAFGGATSRDDVSVVSADAIGRLIGASGAGGDAGTRGRTSAGDLAVPATWGAGSSVDGSSDSGERGGRLRSEPSTHSLFSRESSVTTGASVRVTVGPGTSSAAYEAHRSRKRSLMRSQSAAAIITDVVGEERSSDDDDDDGGDGGADVNDSGGGVANSNGSDGGGGGGSSKIGGDNGSDSRSAATAKQPKRTGFASFGIRSQGTGKGKGKIGGGSGTRARARARRRRRPSALSLPPQMASEPLMFVRVVDWRNAAVLAILLAVVVPLVQMALAVELRGWTGMALLFASCALLLCCVAFSGITGWEEEYREGVRAYRFGTRSYRRMREAERKSVWTRANFYVHKMAWMWESWLGVGGRHFITRLAVLEWVEVVTQLAGVFENVKQMANRELLVTLSAVVLDIVGGSILSATQHVNRYHVESAIFLELAFDVFFLIINSRQFQGTESLETLSLIDALTILLPAIGAMEMLSTLNTHVIHGRAHDDAKAAGVPQSFQKTMGLDRDGRRLVVRTASMRLPKGGRPPPAKAAAVGPSAVESPSDVSAASGLELLASGGGGGTPGPTQQQQTRLQHDDTRPSWRRAVAALDVIARLVVVAFGCVTIARVIAHEAVCRSESGVLWSGVSADDTQFVSGGLLNDASCNWHTIKTLDLRAVPPDAVEALGGADASGAFRRIDDRIGWFTGLRSLDARDNGDLTSVSPAVATLPHLQSMLLSGSPVSQHLSWRGGGLTALPPVLFTVDTLETLDVSGNALAELPVALSSLTRLTALNMSRNRASSIPSAALDPLHALVSLDASHNALASVDGIRDVFRRLSYLDLSHNNLTELPATLGSNAFEAGLYVAPNPVTSIDWFQSSVGRIPAAVCDLPLETLDVDFNNLLGVPPAIGRLAPTLRTIDMSRNGITAAGMPEELTQLPLLRRLDAGYNAYHNEHGLPPPIFWRLHSLDTLDVPCNGFTTLQPEMWTMPNLRTLLVATNLISDLPPVPDADDLSATVAPIQAIDLRATNISSMPDVLLRAPLNRTLFYVSFTQTPLSHVLAEDALAAGAPTELGINIGPHSPMARNLSAAMGLRCVVERYVDDSRGSLQHEEVGYSVRGACLPDSVPEEDPFGSDEYDMFKDDYFSALELLLCPRVLPVLPE